jgi:hypothetical protein
MFPVRACRHLGHRRHTRSAPAYAISDRLLDPSGHSVPQMACGPKSHATPEWSVGRFDGTRQRQCYGNSSRHRSWPFCLFRTQERQAGRHSEVLRPRFRRHGIVARRHTGWTHPTLRSPRSPGRQHGRPVSLHVNNGSLAAWVSRSTMRNSQNTLHGTGQLERVCHEKTLPVAGQG